MFIPPMLFLINPRLLMSAMHVDEIHRLEHLLAIARDEKDREDFRAKIKRQREIVIALHKEYGEKKLSE